MRVWVIRAIIAAAILLALTPVVAYVVDSRNKVTGPQMVADMKTLGAVLKQMGPAYKDVDITVAPDRSRIIVAGTVSSEDERTKLKDALKATPIKAPLSRVTFNVNVK